MTFIYAIPEWLWNTDGPGDGQWEAHNADKCLSLVDVATVPQMAEKTNPANRGGYVAVYSERIRDLDSYLIGSGDAGELKPGQRAKDAWAKVTKTTPQGETVADWLFNHLTGQADPTGDAASKPLMPSHNLALNVHFGRKRTYGRFKFDPENNSHANLVRALLQRDNREHFDRDQTHVRKVLDMQREKYKLGRFDGEDWKELADTEMLRNIDSLLKHETTITDEFNRANADPISTGNFAWTEIASGWEILSNEAYPDNGGNTAIIRAESDLSGEDHYAQVQTVGLQNSGSGWSVIGVCLRFESVSHHDHYQAMHIRRPGSDYGARLRKDVEGTGTQLVLNDISTAAPALCYGSISGSDLSLEIGGTEEATTTDTALTGYTRTGLFGNSQSSTNTTCDDFEAADLGGGGGANVCINRTLLGVG